MITGSRKHRAGGVASTAINPDRRDKPGDRGQITSVAAERTHINRHHVGAAEADIPQFAIAERCQFPHLPRVTPFRCPCLEELRQACDKGLQGMKTTMSEGVLIDGSHVGISSLLQRNIRGFPPDRSSILT